MTSPQLPLLALPTTPKPCADRTEQNQVYRLIVSGSMNPPQLGHVFLGLAAAEGLCMSRIEIMYIPVSTAYLKHKYAAKEGEVATSVFVRCQMLEALFENPDVKNMLLTLAYGSGKSIELVASHIEDTIDDIITSKPGTFTTTNKLISYMQLTGVIQANNVGLVFGLDNLEGMQRWKPEGAFIESLHEVGGDLIIVERDTEGDKPKELNSDTRDWIEQSFNEITEGGKLKEGRSEALSSFYLVPAIPEMRGLSSSALKAAQQAYKTAMENGNDDGMAEEALQKMNKHGWSASESSVADLPTTPEHLNIV